MKLLVTKWFGAAVVEDDRVVARADFPRDAHAIAERLAGIQRGEILEEERELAGPGLAVAEERLRSLGTYRLATPLPFVDPGGAEARLLRDAAMLVARDKLHKASSERDRYVVQAVRAMDEATRTVNTLNERLRDWYALHFPEALRRVTDQSKLSKALAEAPDRAAVARALGGLVPEDSIGASFTDAELGAVRSFAQAVAALYGERERLERVIEADVREVAPTLAGLVGPIIAARLVSHANGLERLASVPASTVQTYGAETALFLHLKEGKRPPKHGVLFQHPLVNTAPWHQRGRIARTLAGLASRAARLDWFSPQKSDRSAALRALLERHLDRIRKKPRPVPQRPGGRRGAPVPAGHARTGAPRGRT